MTLHEASCHPFATRQLPAKRGQVQPPQAQGAMCTFRASMPVAWTAFAFMDRDTWCDAVG